MRTLVLACFLAGISMPGLADTTLITNVNGYTVNDDYELIQFNAIQFTEDTIGQPIDWR